MSGPGWTTGQGTSVPIQEESAEESGGLRMDHIQAPDGGRLPYREYAEICMSDDDSDEGAAEEAQHHAAGNRHARV